MGYKSRDQDSTFGTAIGCVLAFPVLFIMVLILSYVSGLPEPPRWWEWAIAFSIMAIVTFGVFWFVKKISDFLMERSAS